MKNRGIIIGGGIGGLTTALALSRQGIRADVYEQAPVIREVGAGLVLSPNALFVLDRLGLREAVKAIGWPLSEALITKANGRVIQTVDGSAVQTRYGYGMLVVHRGALQKLLLDALPAEQIHTGKQLTNFQDNGQNVRAGFTDGLVAEGQFLIGADGIRSAVRRQLFGEVPLRYSGQVCWRAIVDYTLPPSQKNTSVEYWGHAPGLRVGLVPCGNGQIYMYITTAATADKPDDFGDVKAHLQSLTTGFVPVVHSVIDAIAATRIHQAHLYDLPTLTTWSFGRVTLLGDAAHATTPNLGQGACQAIEDAFAVAACLAGTGPVEQAFSRYEEIRRKKANQVVQLSRQIGQAVNLLGWLKPLAFMAMRMVPSTVSKRQFDAIYNMDYAHELTTTASQSRPVPAE